MAVVVIDGKALAAKVKAQVAEAAKGLSRQPGLAVILVGDDQVVARMAANDRQQRRYSGLRARLARGGPEKEENHGPAPISSEPALPTQVSLL